VVEETFVGADRLVATAFLLAGAAGRLVVAAVLLTAPGVAAAVLLAGAACKDVA